MPNPSFSELFPFERFQELVAALSEPGNEAYQTALERLVEPALRAVLARRLARGELRPVPNADGHDTPFLRAWNGLVSGIRPEGDPDACMDEVIRFLSHSAVGRWAFHVEQEGEPKALLAQARTFHGKMGASMDGGDISHFSLESQSCTVTGETYRVQFQGWNPTFVQWEPGGKLTPMQLGEAASVKEFEVTFETGELLAADWFRIDGFSEAVDAKRPNLGSEKGREDATRRYAELGLVSVHVRNSSPRIFERDGVLVFGKGEGRSVGSVCTDYWGASVIDRARLVEIVASKLGREAAEREVEAYVAKGHAARITVEPGTYHLYMTGEKAHFPALFDPEDVDLDGIEPFFALSPRPLSLGPGPSSPSP